MTATSDATEKAEITGRVRQRYAAAALQLTDVSGTANASCCVPTDLGNGDVFGSILYPTGEGAEIPRRRFWPAWAAATPLPFPTSEPARPFSTSAPAAASTCCSRPGGWARPGSPTAST
ncbi:MAG: Methyltransferase protein [Cryobacterium sp.]|jgi:hypothetical protein|nr:Methyltransferase protein [Cryobacterium sp.]